MGNLSHGTIAQHHSASRIMRQNSLIHEDIKELSMSEWIKDICSKPNPFRNCNQNKKQKFRGQWKFKNYKRPV